MIRFVVLCLALPCCDLLDVCSVVLINQVVDSPVMAKDERAYVGIAAERVAMAAFV